MNKAVLIAALLMLSCAQLAAQVTTPPTPGSQVGTWTEVGPWVIPTGHTSVEFNGRVWVLGGDDGTSARRFNSVWSSADGADWARETDDAGWSKRQGHASVVFDNRMWVIGGDDGVRKKDVWSSTDGATWTLETAAAPWMQRTGHTAFVFNGQMYIIGGYIGQAGPFLNDVWTSSDGINWSQVTAAAQFSARGDHASTVFNNRMWVVGGADGSARSSEVWSSADGITWTLETGTPGFTARRDHTLLAHNGELWLFGGNDGTTLNLSDVWSSTDGVNWTQRTASAAWNTRANHTALVLQSDFMVIGGDHGTPGIDAGLHDTWSSSDGVSWTTLGASGVFGRRVYPATATYQDRLWVLGGVENNGGSPGAMLNDVWSSADGVTWRQEKPVSLGSHAWSGRMGHAAIAFDNKLWVIAGGWKGSGVPQSDVWYSTDGANWTLATSTPGWAARYAHTVQVLNNRMYVIGGGNLSGVLNDVWSSNDGVNWVQETAGAGWAGRYAHTSAVFNNQLWVMGGRGATGASRNDVWSSSDGASWTQATGSAGWEARFGHASCAVDGRLWTMAGHPDEMSLRNDVWSSADGATWEQETNPPWGARAAALSVVTGNRLWLIGGYNGATVFNEIWTYDPEGAPQILSTPDTDVTVGEDWSYTILVAGSPSPTISASGLPAWITLHGNRLEGSPGAGDIGMTGTITISAVNSQGTDSQDFQIIVSGAPLIASTPSTGGTVGQLYSYTVVALGSPTPVISATGLPPWLTLSGNTISGTPDYADVGVVHSVTVTATNLHGTDMQTFDISTAVAMPTTGQGGGDGGGGCVAASASSTWMWLLACVLGAGVLRRRQRA